MSADTPKTVRSVFDTLVRCALNTNTNKRSLYPNGKTLLIRSSTLEDIVTRLSKGPVSENVIQRIHPFVEGALISILKQARDAQKDKKRLQSRYITNIPLPDWCSLTKKPATKKMLHYSTMAKDCKTTCPRDKICNPQTGRCVKKTGAIGQKLVKKNVSKSSKPKTKKTTKKTAKNSSTCPLGKIMNPATGRCVLWHSANGRRLLKPGAKKTFTREQKKHYKKLHNQNGLIMVCPDGMIFDHEHRECIDATSERGQTLEAWYMVMGYDLIRSCPDDKVLNPATGRCVKATGALGRRIRSGKPVKPRKKTTKKRPQKTRSSVFGNELNKFHIL